MQPTSTEHQFTPPINAAVVGTAARLDEGQTLVAEMLRALKWLVKELPFPLESDGLVEAWMDAEHVIAKAEAALR